MKKIKNPQTFTDHLNNKMVDSYLDETKNAEPVEGFTGGNWKLLKGNGTHFATINKDAMTRICTIDVGNIGDKNSGFAPIEEAEANAALLAESKNMYKELKNALHTIQLLAQELNYSSARWHSEHTEPIEAILNRINNHK